MGPGEEYCIEFNDWFACKTPEAKRRYAAEYPEPSGWTDFYALKGVAPG